MKIFLYEVSDEIGHIEQRVTNDDSDILYISGFYKDNDPQSVFEHQARYLAEWAEERNLSYSRSVLEIDASLQTVKWVKS